MTIDTQPLHRRLGMTDEEHESVLGLLGRDPRPAELAMYSVMWSEHCSYKSSRAISVGSPPRHPGWLWALGRMPASSISVTAGWPPSASRATTTLRSSSHTRGGHRGWRHPARCVHDGSPAHRPVGPDPIRPTRRLEESLSVQRGRLGDCRLGNAVGVPTVGGEIEFDPCYSGNPLVNVMCLGILRREQLVLGTAGSPGTVAVLLGRATGRDGIGGASVLASASFDEESQEKRPSVQVGDPFEEKKLIEACLELYEEGLVVGVQDWAPPGSCATSEPAEEPG